MFLREFDQVGLPAEGDLGGAPAVGRGVTVGEEGVWVVVFGWRFGGR